MTMKTSIRLMLLTLAVAGAGSLASPAALARGGDRATLDDAAPIASTLTRAEVRAEALRARQAGETATEFGVARDRFLAQSVVGRSRAQVLAELNEARRLGLVGQPWRDAEPVPVTDAQLRQITAAGERADSLRVSAR